MKKLFFIPVVIIIWVFVGCGEEGNKGECDIWAPDCAEGLVCDPVA